MLLALLRREAKPIKKSECTEEQIAYVLSHAEAGTTVEDECRGMGYMRSHLLHLEEELQTWHQ